MRNQIQTKLSFITVFEYKRMIDGVLNYFTKRDERIELVPEETVSLYQTPPSSVQSYKIIFYISDDEYHGKYTYKGVRTTSMTEFTITKGEKYMVLKVNDVTLIPHSVTRIGLYDPSLFWCCFNARLTLDDIENNTLI